MKAINNRRRFLRQLAGTGAQAVWAEAVMQSQAFQKAAFRAVLMHIPNYYSGDWHGTLH
jgi:hypothetical protein